MANNLYLGDVPPELQNLTIIEQSLISRCRIKCNIIKIHTSSNKDNYLSQLKVSGNIITYPQNPDNILTLLPALPNTEEFQIAFVGKIKPPDETIKKLFKVRKTVIVNALLWLKNNNLFYKDIIISNDNIIA